MHFFFNIQNIFYFSGAKLNFHQPLLQSSVSHDPSEIVLINGSWKSQK